MWYPSQKRIVELKKRLNQLEGTSFTDEQKLYSFLSETSVVLHSLASSDRLPSHRIWDWIWVGSQLRIFNNLKEGITSSAIKGLRFLLEWSDLKNIYSECALKDIRWVTEETIKSLESDLGDNPRKTCLSEEELKLVNDMWGGFYPSQSFDLEEIRQSLNPYLDKFTCVCGDGYIGEVCTKVNDLIGIAGTDSHEARWAASALIYLVHKNDVVPDDLGYFGLVDDIYVIEQAYNIIKNEKSWKPLLQKLNEKWPCLNETIFSEDGRHIKLSRFVQAVSGAILHSLTKKEKTNIILSDVGPTALLSTFLAVVNSIKNQANENRKALEVLSQGDHVVLQTSRTAIKAIYSGNLKRGDETFHSIKLSKDSTVSVSDDIAALMRKAPKKHLQLSSFCTFHDWKSNYSPHPLGHLIGAEINLDSMSPEVLLVTRKNNLDWFHSRLRPFGSSIASLIGVRYISSNLNCSDLPGTKLANPLLWCCSDLSVAIEMLEGEKFRSQFSPKTILVDAAILATDSFDLASRLMKLPDIGVISICGLHEREAWRYLQSKGFENWHINIDNVEPTYEGSEPIRISDNAELSGYLKRNKIHSFEKTCFHTTENELIEKLEKCVRSLRRKADSDPDSGLDVITIVAASLLGAVRKIVLCPDESEHGEIQRLAKKLTLHCNTMMHFDDEARNLYLIAEKFCVDGQALNSREYKIREILGSSPKGPIAVLCQSATLAKNQQQKAAGDEQLQSVQWLSIDQLRREKPLGTLIVSGWLNKLVMREVRNCGFAMNKHFIGFPFERDWNLKSIKTGKSSFAELSVQNEKRFATLCNEYGFKLVSGSNEWQPPAITGEEEVLEEYREGEETGALSHSEWLEAKMADSIRKEGLQRNHGGSVTKGVLMIFETPGYYIYLPPRGKVICLSNVLDASNNIILDKETVDKGISEQLINWPVKDISPGALLAFPEEKKGDLLDSLANKILKNPEETRRLANLWRKALVRAFHAYYANLTELKEDLEKAGISRTVVTLQHWLHSTDIIAPQNCNEEIPIIAKFTRDLELENNLPLVLSSIDKIYKARRQAAGKVVEQILKGDIDHEEGVISLKHDGQEIIYRMLRVKSIDPPIEVVEDKVGVLQYMMA